MKLRERVTSIFDYSNVVLAILAGVLLIFIMLSVVTEVTLRYLAGVSLKWVIEITEYCLLWITFLGAAWLLKKEGHVKMDMVLNRLKAGPQTYMNIITSIVGAIVCLVVTWYGVKVTYYYFQTGFFVSTLLAPLKWSITAIIPLGSFLLFVQFLRRTYGFLATWRMLRDKEQGS